MTQATGLETAGDVIGAREDLSDIIYNITPKDTPFMSNAGRGSADAVLFEWQTDVLQAGAANRQVEGRDFVFSAVNQPSRIANIQQISDKSVIVSETSEAINKAGRSSDLSYHTSKRAVEIKRDIEVMAFTNTAADLATSSTARASGSLLAFIRTNVSKAGDGSNPDAPNPVVSDNRVDGTQRAFTEQQVKDVVALGWASGMNIENSSMLCGAALKAKFSTFEGIATNFKDIKGGQATIVGAADVYVSDFSQFTVVPNRYMRTREVIFVDWAFVEIAYLRPFKRTQSATTGDNKNKVLICEYGYKVKNEAALGGIFDLDATL